MSAGIVVSIHSYRGGTGKSNTTANVAASLVALGKKVAVLDTDLQSPGAHVLFGLQESEIRLTLVDFLWGKCSIAETAYDVTPRIDPHAAGKCWLVPSSLSTEAITRIIDEGYDVGRLNAHFDQLLSDLDLDLLLIDTHPGLNRETLLSTAISDVLIILIRPDQQDYYGTAVLLEIANKLELPHIFLLINKIFSQINVEQLQRRLQETFGHEVIGMIPLHEDIARLESRELITRSNPDHEVSHVFRNVATRLAALADKSAKA